MGDGANIEARLQSRRISRERFATVVDVFGSAAAGLWIDVLPNWAMNASFLHELAASRLTPDEVAQWRGAGIKVHLVPSRAAEYGRKGIGPGEVKRWCAARLDEATLPPLLPQLSAEFGFEELFQLLVTWRDPADTSRSCARGEELRWLLDGRFRLAEVRRTIAQHKTGRALYEETAGAERRRADRERAAREELMRERSTYPNDGDDRGMYGLREG